MISYNATASKFLKRHVRERACLEIRCGGNLTEGSNPSLSAIFFYEKYGEIPANGVGEAGPPLGS